MSLFLTFSISQNIRNSLARSPKVKQGHPGNFWKNVIIRHMASKTHNLDESKRFIPFIEMVESKRAQAKKSVLVQVQSAESHKELFSYCNAVGVVKGMHHYSVGVEPMNFIIVEFENEADVTNILSSSSYADDAHVMPVYSHFLWFKASSRRSPKLKQHKSAVLTVENGNYIMKDNEIKEVMRKCETISEQMTELYNTTKLNDIGTRLRFLTALQVESCVQGMFPHARAFPFGSSVNGYGKMGCDLDLVLRLNDSKEKEESRLVFHCKAATGSDRTISQRNMEAVGDLIQLFLPGCSKVRRILQARVPIIKYFQQLTDVECDLSMFNLSGVYMSDFLYVMGSIDERVRPLVFAIRKWALEVGLTNSSPGRWMTNFSLTLLVLAFLQKPISSSPILPSLNTLIKLAGQHDQFITADGINCTFLRDINKLETKFENKQPLEALLVEFFEFYAQFDFTSKAICLNEAIPITKPEHCAVYIVNPLERGLNVSKNVSLEELERFKSEARNAAWILESQENQTVNWGALSIFTNKFKPSPPTIFKLSNKNSRLMEVSALFGSEDVAQNIDFRNSAVEKQVENIKNETKSKLKGFQKINR